MTSGVNLVPSCSYRRNNDSSQIKGCVVLNPFSLFQTQRITETLNRQEHNGSAVPVSSDHDLNGSKSHQGSLGNVCKGCKTYYCTGTSNIN